MDWAGTKPCLVVADSIVCYEWIISEAEVLFGWSWGVWRVLPFLWASFCCSCFSVVFFWCFTFIYLGGGWGAVLRHCLYFHQLSWKIFVDIFVLECVLGLNVICVHVCAQFVLIICLSLNTVVQHVLHLTLMIVQQIPLFRLCLPILN